jgi:hypothetical protein
MNMSVCLENPAEMPADDRLALRRARVAKAAAEEELSEARAAVERAEVFLDAIEDGEQKVAAIQAAAAARTAEAIARNETLTDDSA